MKTFDSRNIFTPFTVEFAKKYEGKSGYFSDSFNPDLTQWIKGFMLISPSKHKPYNCAEPTTTHYTFFIPDELVKEVKDKKKYRPFLDVHEFLKYFKLGDIVHLKKCHESFEITGIFASYVISSEHCKVIIGVTILPLSSATMNDFQIKINGKWQPFGVLEE